MWQLIEIVADNICSFEHLEYSPIQNQATLAFGNNLDQESQNSNGSGKSALIEAIAISIIGEPLRKVNVDEIINDRFDQATLCAVLQNTETGKEMTIRRTLSRKSPQDIQITLQDIGDPDSLEEIKQASVADYCKYVLEQIGLSKDDILRNFILTARKYQSFLSSSDKEKKEIINRFSNGVMVDQSIEALQADMEPINKKLQEAERTVGEYTGRVEAMSGEIEAIINASAEQKANRLARIQSIKESIVDKRNQIRDYSNEIELVNQRLDALENLDDDMQSQEKSDSNITTSFTYIKEQFQELELPEISDYDEKIKSNLKSLDEINARIEHLDTDSANADAKVQRLDKESKKILASNEAAFKAIDEKNQQLDVEIADLQQKVRKIQATARELADERIKVSEDIANLEKQLAGVIQCPKCSHEFTLSNDISVESARKELANHKKVLVEVEQDISNNNAEYDSTVSAGRQKREEQSLLADQKTPLQDAYRDIQSQLNNAVSEQTSIQSQLKSARIELEGIQRSTTNMRKQMFDEVFEIIDTEVKRADNNIENLESQIAMSKGSVSAFEEQIAELESANDDDVLIRLKDSKAKYESELAIAIERKESVSKELNELKTQEANFLEFKTYLANTKINSISQITNDFLEAIGSDIRVVFSGYTILKSGKVRDKISISLIRNGIDCGSFDKFSAGEKSRVELASVLALQKLSNVNCEDGKGLNLLVIDEILDCTDEAGLANVFKALNETQVTALVVSHGNIAENYPNRIVITKQNGVSTINER